MFIAICSDPKILPDFKAFLKFFCHTSQCGAFSLRQNTPMFKWGFKATDLAIFSENPEDLACL